MAAQAAHSFAQQYSDAGRVHGRRRLYQHCRAGVAASASSDPGLQLSASGMAVLRIYDAAGHILHQLHQYPRWH